MQQASTFGTSEAAQEAPLSDDDCDSLKPKFWTTIHYLDKMI